MTRYADRVLNPLVGKSLVVYLTKPADQAVGAGPAVADGRSAPDREAVA